MTVSPGYYWFMPFRNEEPHPVKIANLEQDEKLRADNDRVIGLVAWYIGEGWYEPLESLLEEGELVRLEAPAKPVRHPRPD